MSEAADQIIRRFMAVFGEPRTPEPDLFLAEFARCMDRIDVEALQTAADRLIKTSVYWPKPAELISEAERVIAERNRAKRRAEPEHERWTQHARTPEATAMANELTRNFCEFVKRNTTDSRSEVKVDWRRGQRDAFEATQRESANQGMHMTWDGLSRISRRITGEGKE